MRRCLPILAAFVLLPMLAAGQARPLFGKPILDRWLVRNTPQGRIGVAHLECREVERDGRRLIHSRQTDTLSYIRSGDPYTETDSVETWETASGEIVQLRYRTPLGKAQMLDVRGTPQGKEIRLEVLNDKTGAVVFTVMKPWDAAALGLHAQEFVLAGKKLEPGAAFAYHAFQTSMNAVLRCTLTVVGPKKTKVNGRERELVELRQTYPKGSYYDPTTLYADPKTGEIVKTEEESTSFGSISQELAARADADQPLKPTVKDKESPITINKAISPFRRGGPRELRLVLKHDVDDDLASVFVPEARQQILRRAGREAEVRLLAPRALDQQPEEPKPAPEYVESNFYIRSDAPEVTSLAKKIVGDEKEPRKQMKLIRTWVRTNVKGHYEVPFATADEVARTLEGDCTEMGCLAAALARALGIPARVAFGLVYDPNEPGFGGHLWTEAYLDGRWEAWDPTGVLQSLGAAYLKVGDYSMKGVLNPDELTNVRRAFAGKLQVELVEAK